MISIFSDVSQIRDSDLGKFKQVLIKKLEEIEHREERLVPQSLEEIEKIENKLKEGLEELNAQKQKLKTKLSIRVHKFNALFNYEFFISLMDMF